MNIKIRFTRLEWAHAAPSLDKASVLAQGVIFKDGWMCHTVCYNTSIIISPTLVSV